MKAKLSIICIIFFFFISKTYAQNNVDTLTQRYYQQALHQIDIKNFEEANDYFKKIFKLKTTLPDELAYFYGYTLLHLQKYTQGREFLKKYIELRGDTGRLYSYAQTYINYADCKETGSYNAEESCSECQGSGATSRSCTVCHGKGIEKCDVCLGLGVIKHRDPLSDTFKDCIKCSATGYYSCSRCKGTTVEAYRCYVCDGKGKVRIKKDCDGKIMLPE